MTALADEVIRARVSWADARALDALAQERGSTRGEVVAAIVAGALEAEVVDDLLDLGRQTPSDPSQEATT